MHVSTSSNVTDGTEIDTDTPTMETNVNVANAQLSRSTKRLQTHVRVHSASAVSTTPTEHSRDIPPHVSLKALCPVSYDVTQYEAKPMRNAGGMSLNSNGRRFCNEACNWQQTLCEMNGTFYFCLNTKAAAAASCVCARLLKRGIMVHLNGAVELDLRFGIPPDNLRRALAQYNAAEWSQRAYGKSGDAWGKTTLRNAPLLEHD